MRKDDDEWAGAPTPRYVLILQQLAALRDGIEQLEYQVVQLMRDAGTSWQAIGDELGYSRQRAASYFSQPKPRRAPKR